MLKRKISLLLVFLIFGLFLVSCTHFDKDMKEGAPNYSNPNLWITSFDKTHQVDVFYVYPTVSQNESGNMDVYDNVDRDLAKGIYKAQASVFESNANIYAPYYRQMSTYAKIPDDPNVLATDLVEFKLGVEDVKAAFKYYIENLNEG